MAPAAEHNPGSDTEGGEKPVREQLKKATIAAQGGLSGSSDVPPSIEAEAENGERGREDSGEVRKRRGTDIATPKNEEDLLD